MRALAVRPPSRHNPYPREVAAPGWENANGLLTSVTACRPHPCRRHRGPHPTPTLASALCRPARTVSRKIKNKLKSRVRADYRTTRAWKSPRGSGWILRRRHEAQRRRQLSRCRAPTLLSAGSRSPTPAQPGGARGHPGSPARAPLSECQGAPGLWRGAPGASWRPRLGHELRTGPAPTSPRGGNCPGSPRPGLLRNKRKVRAEDPWVGLDFGVGTSWLNREGP